MLAIFALGGSDVAEGAKMIRYLLDQEMKRLSSPR
jgi:hypothetical protein